MSKQSAQLEAVDEWLGEAKDALRSWGGYYRAGFSALSPSDSMLGRYYSGQIQQRIAVTPRAEAENTNDQTDHIVSGLPSVLRRALVEVYGMRYSVRAAAERAGMNRLAFRDTLQMAESGVAVGLSLAVPVPKSGRPRKPSMARAY